MPLTSLEESVLWAFLYAGCCVTGSPQGYNMMADEDQHWLWDAKTASEMGAKGAKVAQANRQRRKSDPMWPIKKSLPSLFAELLKAAKGEGQWDDLPASQRLDALKTCLLYGVGRPVGLDKAPKDEDRAQGPAEGLQVE